VKKLVKKIVKVLVKSLFFLQHLPLGKNYLSMVL
jgi:hypothetical protein